jgi:hypothetical protein
LVQLLPLEYHFLACLLKFSWNFCELLGLILLVRQRFMQFFFGLFEFGSLFFRLW